MRRLSLAKCWTSHFRQYLLPKRQGQHPGQPTPIPHDLKGRRSRSSGYKVQLKISKTNLFVLSFAAAIALCSCGTTRIAPTEYFPMPRIFPTTRVLPSNHLKFYIFFVEPMEQGDIFRHLRLLRSNHAEIAGPFRETELWAPDGRQLTLWLHPGRQKSKVNLNVDEGPVLLPDQQYQLEISGEWKTQSGLPLGKTIRHTFRCTAPDTTQPDPARWEMTVPNAGSTVPLRINFGEPLDWALLQSEMNLFTAEGKPVTGRVRIGEWESSWEFHSNEPWKPGSYEVKMGIVLEDLAGNNLARPFEVDISKPVTGSFRKPTQLPFTITKRANSSPDPCSPQSGQARR